MSFSTLSLSTLSFLFLHAFISLSVFFLHAFALHCSRHRYARPLCRSTVASGRVRRLWSAVGVVCTQVRKRGARVHHIARAHSSASKRARRLLCTLHTHRPWSRRPDRLDAHAHAPVALSCIRLSALSNSHSLAIPHLSYFPHLVHTLPSRYYERMLTYILTMTGPDECDFNWHLSNSCYPKVRAACLLLLLIFSFSFSPSFSHRVLSPYLPSRPLGLSCSRSFFVAPRLFPFLCSHLPLAPFYAPYFHTSPPPFSALARPPLLTRPALLTRPLSFPYRPNSQS